MLGLETLGQLAKLASSDFFTKFAADAQAFMQTWTGALNRMGEKLNRIEAAIERVDNKASLQLDELQTVREQLAILVSDTNLTPELHESILEAAADDPRQAEVRAAEYDPRQDFA